LAQYKDPDAVCTAIEARLEAALPPKGDSNDNADDLDNTITHALECTHLRNCPCSLIHALDYPSGPKPVDCYQPVASSDSTIEILLESSRNGLQPLAVVTDHGPKPEATVNKQGHRKYLRRLVPNADVALDIEQIRLSNGEAADVTVPESVLEVKETNPESNPLLHNHRFTIYYCLGQEKPRPKPKRDQPSPDNSVPLTPRDDLLSSQHTTAASSTFTFDPMPRARAAGSRAPSLASSKAGGGSNARWSTSSSVARTVGDDDVIPPRAPRQASDGTLTKSDGDDKLDKRHVWRKLTLELTGGTCGLYSAALVAVFQFCPI
jgi:hypothetical protein